MFAIINAYIRIYINRIRIFVDVDLHFFGFYKIIKILHSCLLPYNICEYVKYIHIRESNKNHDYNSTYVQYLFD